MNNEGKSRERGENWTQEEKDLLMDIMRQSASIIENKQTDTNTNKQKTAEWIKVQSKLRELTGKSRELYQLKGFWRRAKIAAKKNFSDHKRALNSTGGGLPPPPPSLDDVKVMELCPKDFIIEYNQYDSDGISHINDQGFEADGQPGTAKSMKDDNIIYDIELNETNSNEMDASFINKIVNVSDIHNTEVQIETRQNKGEEIIFTDKQVKRNDQKSNISGNKNKKNVASHKGLIVSSNIEMKKRSMQLLEQEYEYKIKYQQKELAQQDLRHKLEKQYLIMRNHKTELEIRLLKKQFD